MDLLDGDETVFESLDASFPQAGQGALRTLAGCFGFSGDDVEKPCRVLSGGEKARLVMAKMLFDPPNFLVLDEPTNHLDMATKEMLVAALAALSNFEGTMLFVSHDRHFLAALSNRVLELTPDGIHQLRRRLHRIRAQRRREQLAGFWLWEVKDMDEAVAWVKRCPNPMPRPSEVEIRPLCELSDLE
jgi:ATPase subunit of ABC transporter with duplicated ATPase domains